MIHTQFLFYILGAIQLGTFQKIVGLGARELVFENKINLVQANGVTVDEQDGISEVQIKAINLFNNIIWYRDKQGMELCINQIEELILEVIEDKSVHSYDNEYMVYYLAGAYNLNATEDITISRSKLESLRLVDSTELYKSLMFLMTASDCNFLSIDQIKNIRESIINQVEFIERESKAKLIEQAQNVSSSQFATAIYPPKIFR